MGGRALAHVRWIGGGSAAGKSTTAARLAAENGLHLHRTDETMSAHARRCPPRRCPHLRAFAAMSMDERWVHRSPRTMPDTFHWYRGEAFDLVVEDLLDLPADRGVLVEGFRLLPHLVAPLLTGPERAVWLLPTPRFRRAALEARGDLWAIAGRTGDPPRALANLLERDRLFTDRLREQTRRHGLRAIEVDAPLDGQQLAAQVARSLGLRAPTG
ncbi:hypothetical protein [Kineococcus sp. G2]|uniref:hypothetical protein n=1 Tax=Kineococcus sp. G2 TaxID=3127484 RepID=UPI00301C0834